MTSNLWVANATWVNLPFDTQDAADQITYDATDRRFTVPKDGRYVLNSAAHFQANATGLRAVRVLVNSAPLAQVNVMNAGSANHVTGPINRTLKLVAGDVVQVGVYQKRGEALNVIGTAVRLTCDDLTYVGP